MNHTIALNQQGLNYQDLKNYDSALFYLHKGLKMKMKINAPKPTIAISLGNIGYCYIEQNKVTKALKYYVQATDTYRAFGNIDSENRIDSTIKKIYQG